MNDLLEEYDECQELRSTVDLWGHANDAKAGRIAALEQECARLRKKVALLSRRAARCRRGAPGKITTRRLSS